MTDQVPEGVSLPIRWVGVEETPLLVANQFLGQTGTGDIILNFGAVVPPPILPGTPEQQAEQLEEYTYVPVRAVARLGVTRAGLEQLIGVLNQTLRELRSDGPSNGGARTMTETYFVRPGATEGTRGFVPTPGESGRQDDVQIRRSSGSRTYSVYAPPLAALSLRITSLVSWRKEWDGYQMAPSRESVVYAFRWIKGLYEDVPRMGEEWIDPLISADAHENVVFEWWEGQKKLTIYVTPTEVEYVKVSGPDIFSDMEDGEVEGVEDRRALWHWLTTS